MLNTHVPLLLPLIKHKNEVVNEELWNEARTYGDIQLMPFVDYYSLILWKTIAICIYGVCIYFFREIFLYIFAGRFNLI